MGASGHRLQPLLALHVACQAVGNACNGHLSAVKAVVKRQVSTVTYMVEPSNPSLTEHVHDPLDHPSTHGITQNANGGHM